jgi:hypothetical protein
MQKGPHRRALWFGLLNPAAALRARRWNTLTRPPLRRTIAGADAPDGSEQPCAFIRSAVTDSTAKSIRFRSEFFADASPWKPKDYFS